MKTGFNFTSKILSIEMASVFLFSSNNMGAMMLCEKDLQSRSE